MNADQIIMSVGYEQLLEEFRVHCDDHIEIQSIDMENKAVSKQTYIYCINKSNTN